MTELSDYLDQIAGILAGLAVLFIAGGLAMRVERARWERRLSSFLNGQTTLEQEGAAAVPRSPQPPSRQRRLLDSVRLGATPLELQQAGLTLTPRKFLGIQLLTVVAGLWIGRLAAVRSGWEGWWLWAAIALGLVVGLWLPRAVMRFLRHRRLGRFERQFSIAIDSIANALESGLSLPQSIELMGRDMPPPLGLEFSRVSRDMGLGLSLGEALDGMLARVPLTDVEIFVTAVHIQYRTGGNLSQILRTIAHTVRERLRIRGHIRVLTAQARLSSYIVTGLPFFMAFMIRWLNPAYFQGLLEAGAMRIALIAAVIFVGLGFYILRRIANIEV
jgi:tight adherence protein B